MRFCFVDEILIIVYRVENRENMSSNDLPV